MDAYEEEACVEHVPQPGISPLQEYQLGYNHSND